MNKKPKNKKKKKQPYQGYDLNKQTKKNQNKITRRKPKQKNKETLY